MKKIDWKVIVLLGIILSVIIGFAFGTGILGGATADPGTEADPLVTQSYADQSINNTTQDLAAQVEELTLKVQVLENDLTELYAMVGKTRSTVAGSTTGTTTGTPGTTTGTTTGSTGTTTGTAPGTTTTNTTVSSDNIGKTATIAQDNNVVNLRKTASTSAEIVRKLSKTDTFTITKVDKDWYQVQLSDGTVGWVAGWLVSMK